MGVSFLNRCIWIIQFPSLVLTCPVLLTSSFHSKTPLCEQLRNVPLPYHWNVLLLVHSHPLCLAVTTTDWCYTTLHNLWMIFIIQENYSGPLIMRNIWFRFVDPGDLNNGNYSPSLTRFPRTLSTSCQVSCHPSWTSPIQVFLFPCLNKTLLPCKLLYVNLTSSCPPLTPPRILYARLLTHFQFPVPSSSINRCRILITFNYRDAISEIVLQFPFITISPCVSACLLISTCVSQCLLSL